MGRKVGIIAYGTVEERQQLEALARLAHKSASRWIIDMIHSEHDAVFAPLALGGDNRGADQTCVVDSDFDD